ncbi:putative encoded peptide [Helianthus debilis subsp. tardiflorus]
MARLCRTFFCCVLLMLFVSNEVLQISEARKLGENFKCTTECLEGKVVTQETGSANPNQVSPSGVTIKEGDLDAFRPTTPGHSPGVGH